MKHKILLATNASEEFDNLLKDLLNLLNKTHQKYVSAFSPKSFQSNNLVMANASSDERSIPLDYLVKDFEREAVLAKKASASNVAFEWIHEKLNNERLVSLSTVSDVLILEKDAFSNCDVSLFEEILSAVKCPILLLPKDWEIENLVVFHDGSIDSVKMVKNFINLFDPSLRKLPLSVLINHPEGKYDTESEKAFIDYLKLFFDNIGVQQIHGDLMDNLTQAVVYNSNKPFLMLGIKDDSDANRKIIDSPTFLFKG